MKAFRYFLVTAFLFVTVIDGYSQKEEKKRQIHKDVKGKEYAWSLSNEGCYGCASFYWKIERETEPDAEGLYTYYIVFSTNSFYADKILTSTYITDFKLYFIDGQTKYIGVKPFYILVPPEVKKEKMFKSKNPDQIFEASWSPVKLLNK